MSDRRIFDLAEISEPEFIFVLNLNELYVTSYMKKSMVYRLHIDTAQMMRAIFFLLMIPAIILLEDSNVLAKVHAYPSEDVIIFNATGQPGGLVDADKTIDINVKSGPKDWIVRYQALALKGSEGQIPPGRISVNSPYTDGYEEMSGLRVVAKGDDKVTKPVAIGPVRFRLQTTWEDKPGTYTGLLISPDGAQSINVKLIINPFTSILLDPPSVYFDALGHPSVFDAVSEVAVKVSSNYAGWTVSCKAAPLSLTGRGNNTISNERIFVGTTKTKNYRDEGAGRGFMKMHKPILLGSGNQTPPIELERLRFRLLTTWEDRAGTYDGDITFTFLVSP